MGTFQEGSCENTKFPFYLKGCLPSAAPEQRQIHLDMPAWDTGLRKADYWVCSLSGAFCQDHFHWCPLVPQHGMCSHQFYGEQCCRACSTSNL